MITKVIQLIKEEQRKNADNVVANPLTHELYLTRCGFQQGLSETLKIIDEVLQGNEED